MSYTLGRLLGEPTQNLGLIVTASVITTIALLGLTKIAFQEPPRKVIPSPRVTQLPKLSKEEQNALPYGPDTFPGARDVVSPVSHVRHNTNAGC